MPTKTFYLIFLSLLVVVVPINSVAEGDEQPKPGKAAPLFELTTLQNDTVALANLHGTFVVIHFAASW